MKTLERNTPVADDKPTQKRLRIHEGALVPGGKKAVHYNEDGVMTLVDAPKRVATKFDAIVTHLPDVAEAGQAIVAEDAMQTNFAEVLSPETLAADSTENGESVEERLPLRKRVARKLGGFVAKVNYGYAAALTKLGEKQGKSLEKDKARRKKYEKQDGDSRRTRARKFLGRNGTMLAAGATLSTLVGATLAARYMNIDLGGSGAGAATHDMAIQHGEIVPTAKTQILIGGRGMPDGDAMRPIANGLGLRGEKTIGVDYPAGIKTWVTPGDTHTLDQSSAISAQKAYDAYQANKNGTVEFVGYSLGTQGLEDALDRIAQENGGTLPDNVSVKIIASPNTEGSGVFTDPKVKMLEPLFAANGATMDRPMPKGKNVQVIAMNTDFWANAGNRPPSTMISQAIGLAGDGHRAPEAGMRYTERVVDGTVYRTYYHDGTQNAALRVAEQRGFKVTKKADNFANAIAPTGEIGQKDVRVDAGEVLNTGAAAAEEALVSNGVAPAQAHTVKSVIENVPVQPVQAIFDAVQDIPNQVAALPELQPAVQQAAPVIEQAVKQATPLLNQFGIKLK